MADHASHPEQEQIERAKKLREQIERLKKGHPRDDEGNEPQDNKGGEQGKSLKEQIEEREAEQRRPADTD